MERFTSQHPRRDLPKLQALLAAEPVWNEEDHPRDEQGRFIRRCWYRITNLSQTEAEIYLYDEIGMWGVTAGDFVNELRDIKAKTIMLRINSPGGDVFDGIAIFNALQRHSATINAFIDGIAASAASFIAMAGDTVTMMPHSQMMIHEASGLVIGPADDMRKMADILDKSSENIASIYAEKAGGTVDEWRARMREETWLSDQEAVDLGLADGIDGAMQTCPDCGAEVAMGVQICPDCGASMTNRAEPIVNELEPEPEEPKPIDFAALFDEIADEAYDMQFEGAATGG